MAPTLRSIAPYTFAGQVIMAVPALSRPPSTAWTCADTVIT